MNHKVIIRQDNTRFVSRGEEGENIPERPEPVIVIFVGKEAGEIRERARAGDTTPRFLVREMVLLNLKEGASRKPRGENK